MKLPQKRIVLLITLIDFIGGLVVGAFISIAFLFTEEEIIESTRPFWSMLGM